MSKRSTQTSKAVRPCHLCQSQIEMGQRVYFLKKAVWYLCSEECYRRALSIRSKQGQARSPESKASKVTTKKTKKRPRLSPQQYRHRKFINSPEWKQMREYYWDVNGKTCKVPGCSEDKRLELHHRTYDRFGGDELMSDLVGLCNRHHIQVHRIHQSKYEKDWSRLGDATDEVVGKKRLVIVRSVM